MSLTATPTPRKIASLAFLSTTTVCKRQLSRTPKPKKTLVSHFNHLSQRSPSTICYHEQVVHAINKKCRNGTDAYPESNTDIQRNRSYASNPCRIQSSAALPKRSAHYIVREYGSMPRTSTTCPTRPSLHNKKRHYSTPHFETPSLSSPAPETLTSSNFDLCPPTTSVDTLRVRPETSSVLPSRTQPQGQRTNEHAARDIPPKVKIERFPSSRYTFSTYEMVTKFEKAGRYTRSQSLAITECIHHFLKGRLGQYQGQLLTKSDLENESYLFKAALSELRTELQIHRRNDTANLKSDVNAVMREVDSLHIKLREDMSNLKSDIAMEMNTRKAEMSESAKKTEFGMLEANNRYTVELSDVRTEIEQMKWQTTKKAAAFTYCLIVVGFTGYYFMYGESSTNADSADNQNQASDDGFDQEAQMAGSTNSTKALEGPQCGIAGPGM